jgi:hypothetical protein
MQIVVYSVQCKLEICVTYGTVGTEFVVVCFKEPSEDCFQLQTERQRALTFLFTIVGKDARIPLGYLFLGTT